MNEPKAEFGAPEANFGELFRRILKKAADNRSEHYKDIILMPEVAQAIRNAASGDVSAFRQVIASPMENIMTALVEAALPEQQNGRAAFLLTHTDFVTSHFRAVYSEFEGNSCCADKAHTAVSALGMYFIQNKPIVFDYEAEYTFHLPVKVLANQVSILEFYEALYNLYFCRTKLFLSVMLNLLFCPEDPITEQEPA